MRSEGREEGRARDGDEPNEGHQGRVVANGLEAKAKRQKTHSTGVVVSTIHATGKL
jgi:hypothetical protein